MGQTGHGAWAKQGIGHGAPVLSVAEVWAKQGMGQTGHGLLSVVICDLRFATNNQQPTTNNP